MFPVSEAVSNLAAHVLQSQIAPGQIHLLIAQNGNARTPGIEWSNTQTG